MDLAARPGRLSNLTFCLVWAGVRAVLHVLFRLRVEGAPPRSGAYVVVANHVSFIDPLVVGAVVPRRVVFLMTEVVYRSRVSGWFYRWNRAIPLSTRNANRDALRAARQVLQQGRVVGIFPEGGISRDGLPMLGSPGAVSLVLNERVPIVPVGLIGTHEVLPFGSWRPRWRKITIRYGTPIRPDELAPPDVDRRERLQRATELIMGRIAELTGNESREAALLRMRSESDR
ncbi:MAG: 1-acyl-sn-glycerol-3-phosphate acyltransferase [Planctomycetes bacterium]|nr:1-acyl-sn-glycerol-3-phosphate acyltransferase [Planctomycetota bacterium]